MSEWMDPKVYFVWHEKGGYIQVFADSEEDAREQFYLVLESIFGPIARGAVVNITKVEGPFRANYRSDK